MSFKIKDTILFKEDQDGKGIIFSVEDQSDNFLKISGVAKDFMRKMIDGISFEDVRASILDEYEVEADVLDRDLEELKSSLEKIAFLA